MNKILITGASGFVGRALVQHLSGQGEEVHAVYRKQIPAESDKVVWHQTNLFDSRATEALFAEVMPTHLVQLAWCAEYGTYWRDVKNLDWVTANLHIARQFINHGGQRGLFAGTSAEYSWTDKEPLHEFHSPLNPTSLYGGCKLSAYWALKTFFEQENVSFSWARLFNPFGPYEDARRLIPKICLRLLKNEKINFDAGSALRDFLYVEDVGEALSAVLNSSITGPINVASGQPISIRTILVQIASQLDRTDLVFFQEETTPKIDIVVADVNRLQNQCGWRPAKNLSTRIQETCEWWKKQLNN